MWISTRGIDARFYGLPADAYTSATTYIDAVVRGALWATDLLGLCSWILVATRRRLLEEFVFAVHLVAALMFGTGVGIGLGTGWKLVWGTTHAVPSVLPALPFLVFLPLAIIGVGYVFLATRTVHGGTWWASLVRTIFFGGAGVRAFMHALERLLRS